MDHTRLHHVHRHTNTISTAAIAITSSVAVAVTIAVASAIIITIDITKAPAIVIDVAIVVLSACTTAIDAAVDTHIAMWFAIPVTNVMLHNNAVGEQFANQQQKPTDHAITPVWVIDPVSPARRETPRGRFAVWWL